MRSSFSKSIPILILALIFLSCATIKKPLYVGEGGIENARMNVIDDFANTYKTPKLYLKRRRGKPFSAFYIYSSDSLESNEVYLISILPEVELISIRTEHKLGKIPRVNFPNRYVVKENKLFLWNDGETLLQKEVVEAMNKFGVLDSTDLKWELGLLPDDFEDTRMITIDDRLESHDYFICKSDISKYKKVVTWKALGYYDKPKIICP